MGIGFLPGRFQGVKFRGQGDPILDLYDPAGVTRSQRRRMLDTLGKLNQAQADHYADPDIRTRIAQYELAYRMQTSVPELIDFSTETQSVVDSYGPEVRKVGKYAYNCLLARRLAERGVRFIQLFHRGWDAHGGAPGNVVANARIPISRPPRFSPTSSKGACSKTPSWFGAGNSVDGLLPRKLTRTNYGRDHHPNCFTYWLAGGGVKAGFSYGKTDDYSVSVVENPVHGMICKPLFFICSELIMSN